ncbi:MAG: DUF167 domain-containing protein [Candidatus Acidiferrales bacterium]
MIEVTEKAGEVTFRVRVQPRGSRESFEGEWGGALKIRLTAPPVEGRANEALRRLLAARLKIPVAAVRIVAGEKSRSKRVAVAGVSAAAIRALAEGNS